MSIAQATNEKAGSQEDIPLQHVIIFVSCLSLSLVSCSPAPAPPRAWFFWRFLPFKKGAFPSNYHKVLAHRGLIV